MTVEDVIGSVPVELSNGRPHTLSYRQAVDSPCLTCTQSPCCTHLLLRKFKVEDLGDADYLVYLTGFDGIYITIDRQSIAHAYLYQPCGFLDTASGLCGVHSTPLQPSICIHYNAHACRYRQVMTDDLYEPEPLLDLDRARWYVEHTTFDDRRNVVEPPSWPAMIEAFQEMPLKRAVGSPPAPDPALVEWKSVVLKGFEEDHHSEHVFADPVVIDPCSACSAYCCKTLVFPHDIPSNSSQFDFFRYCLGFPSVELGVGEENWYVVVRTTCRHLDGNRCSLHGSDQRPLRCGYYDALKCVYRFQFGQARPVDYVRVPRDAFPALANLVVFDEWGQVLRSPSVDLLRGQIEGAMQAGVI